MAKTMKANSGDHQLVAPGQSKQVAYVLTPALTLVLAICAGTSVANLYYAQPLLHLIGSGLGEVSQVGWIPVATQTGYMVGIIMIVPLGDLLDRRRLTASLATLASIAWLCCAAMPSVMALAIASAVVGVGATATQILLPLAADLALPEQRGRVLGTVFSGVLSGILLARTVSGAAGAIIGWRATFLLSAGAAMALSLVLWRTLPSLPPKTTLRYRELLQSTLHLLMRYRTLRYACGVQACLFGLFSGFWSMLALHLAEPPFHLGPAAAGAFGLIGIVGVLAARPSGRYVDKHGPSASLAAGLAACVVAFLIFASTNSLSSLVAGVIVMDFGLSVVNVSNQTRVLSLDPDARNRINTVFVGCIFFGGAAGSGAASLAWNHRGWPGVCAAGLVLALAAVIVEILHRVGRKPRVRELWCRGNV